MASGLCTPSSHLGYTSLLSLRFGLLSLSGGGGGDAWAPLFLMCLPYHVLLLFLPPNLDFIGARGHRPAALEIRIEADVVLSLNKFNQYYFWEFTIVFSCSGKGEFGRMEAWWVWEVCLFIRVQKIKKGSYTIFKKQSLSWFSLVSK